MSALRVVLTENDLREGGRRRHPLAVYLSLDGDGAGFFPQRERFGVTVDDLRVFECYLGGRPIKNLRSVPETRFGEWLLQRRLARAGDAVEFTALPNGRYYARFLRQLPQEDRG